VFSSSLRASRITIFSTGVALGLSILSGPASAATATPTSPSGDGGVVTVDGIMMDGAAVPPVDPVPPADEVLSVDPVPSGDAVPPEAEVAPPPVDDQTVATTPPTVVLDEPVAASAVVFDRQAAVTEPVTAEARPLVITGRGIPASPVVALAPGNWGISARVVAVRRASRDLSFTAAPVPTQVLGTRLTAGETLPRTGVDTGLMTVVAILLVGIGTVLTHQGRAPSPATAGSRT